MRDFSSLPCLCRLFRGIPAADIQSILEHAGARVTAVKDGGSLFVAGDRADRFGVVLSGSLCVVSYKADGRKTIIKRVGPMEVVAAAQAVARARFTVTVEAETQSEVLVLKSAPVVSPPGSGGASHIRLMRNLLEILAEKTLALNGKIGILSHRATAERLMDYLEEMAEKAGSREFDIPFDRQGLADFLCVERSALSSEIGRLVREGVIKSCKNHFEFPADARRPAGAQDAGMV